MNNVDFPSGFRPCKSHHKRVLACWGEFDRKFPTERECLNELFKRAKDSLKCPNCHSWKIEQTNRGRLAKCRDCRKWFWFTAGTFFHRIRRAKPWLAAVWLFEHGIIISSLTLHKLAGVAQSSACNILRKLMALLRSNMKDSDCRAPSKFFIPILCKRSRETPARAHPMEEVALNEPNGSMSASQKRQSHSIVGKVIEAPLPRGHDGGYLNATTKYGPSQGGDIASELQDRDHMVLNLLSDTPEAFDDLCHSSGLPARQLSASLVMLELAEAVQRLPGDRYVVARHEEGSGSLFGKECSPQVGSIISGFLQTMKTYIHGISRKYLQNYLAAYWCQRNFRHWQGGEFLDCCLKSSPISYRQLLAYVSPDIVQLGDDHHQLATGV